MSTNVTSAHYMIRFRAHEASRQLASALTRCAYQRTGRGKPKVSYPDRRTARHALLLARVASARYDDWSMYGCRPCSGFHLTTRPDSAPMNATQRRREQRRRKANAERVQP